MGDQTRIEVITEILESPKPSVTVHYLKRETDTAKRERMVEPDFVDETIRYGTEMALRLGRAFQGGTNHSPMAGIPVGKQLLKWMAGHCSWRQWNGIAPRRNWPKCSRQRPFRRNQCQPRSQDDNCPNLDWFRANRCLLRNDWLK